jgi:hypothetical protein
MCSVPVLLVIGGGFGVLLVTRGRGEGKMQQKTNDEDSRESG